MTSPMFVNCFQPLTPHGTRVGETPVRTDIETRSGLDYSCLKSMPPDGSNVPCSPGFKGGKGAPSIDVGEINKQEHLSAKLPRFRSFSSAGRCEPGTNV